MGADAITLTSQLESASLTMYDLGSGYAQITLPDYLLTTYSDLGWLNQFRHQTARGRSDLRRSASQQLDEAARSFLAMRSDSADVKMLSTFSGSIALDRALTGLLNMLKSHGHKVVQVITTTPSIDIISLLLAEHSHVHAHFVRSNRRQTLGELDAQAIVEQLDWLRQVYPDDGRLVLLASPENPTGFVWDASALQVIARTCAEHGAPLLVDHSFLVAGVHHDPLARIWDVGAQGNMWVGLWDTGKTIALDGDKLGFIFAPNNEISAYIEEALAVTQFDVSLRQKATFARILTSAGARGYSDHLKQICVQNLHMLTQTLKDSGIEVRHPPAGSLALLTLPDGLQDEDTRLRLLGAGVGVVAGNVFFHDTWKMRNTLRLALARDVDYFSSAVQIMAQILDNSS